MWLVLHWAWEGRKHRARTTPMPELVCRVRTKLSSVPGLLLLPLLSPTSQQTCHPTAMHSGIACLAQMAHVPTPALSCAESLS